jgi:hypothetical protein
VDESKVVEVRWTDHAFAADLEDADTVEQVSIGYLVSKDARVIKIAQTITTAVSGKTDPADILTVDRRMVRSIKQLPRKKENP